MISKNVLRLLLFPALVFCTSMTGSAICVQNASPVVDIQQEKGKWSYLRENLEKQEAGLAGFSGKFGSILIDGAVFISMPIGGYLAGIVSEHSYLNNWTSMILDYYLDHYSDEEDRLICRLIGTICGAAIGLTFYGLCKVIGRALQAHPAMCKQILTGYIAEWSKHKANTPEVLHPIFEAMHVDLAMNNGNLAQVDPDKARQIVESLFAASVLFAVTK